ncbi:MAG: hypothetical protein C4542_05255 [Dehalococcoidia bacterium]|nr:MAG: hypothetical protein C4542_05255 [Dehalococcoidia bacterium]
MKLQVISENRMFDTVLDFAVLDRSNYLQAASFGGLQTAVSAVGASIVHGLDSAVVAGDNSKLAHARFGHYKRFESPLGNDLHHGFVLTKDAVYTEEPESPVVLAPDGDISEAVGKYIAARYTLPVEWSRTDQPGEIAFHRSGRHIASYRRLA